MGFYATSVFSLNRILIDPFINLSNIQPMRARFYWKPRVFDDSTGAFWVKNPCLETSPQDYQLLLHTFVIFQVATACPPTWLWTRPHLLPRPSGTASPRPPLISRGVRPPTTTRGAAPPQGRPGKIVRGWRGKNSSCREISMGHVSNILQFCARADERIE